MWWLAAREAWDRLPRRLRTAALAALGGALALSLALGAGWAYIERERRQAAAGEHLRIETEAMRDRVRVIERERNRGHEIDQLGSDDLLGRLRGWVRPD